MKGIKGTVLTLIHAPECPRVFTIADILDNQDQFDYVQISNSVNLMAREGKLIRTGTQGSFNYEILSENEAALDPIENLLEAMALAEPALRKLAKANRLLTNIYKEE